MVKTRHRSAASGTSNIVHRCVWVAFIMKCFVVHRRMMRFPIAFGSLNFVPLGKSM